MRISILTICPEIFGSFLKSPLISRGEREGKQKTEIVDIRDFADGCFRKVDDSPYGGGAGMILRMEPVLKAISSVRTENSYIAALTPAGCRYDQKKARELSRKEHLILLCGHYEGIDERIYSYTDELISIGDYVLTGGELPAMVIADSVLRLCEGGIRRESLREESFDRDLLEYPQYTRPAVFEGLSVPEVLLSGNHEAIRKWREQEALRLTRERRPDLLDDTGRR